MDEVNREHLLRFIKNNITDYSDKSQVIPRIIQEYYTTKDNYVKFISDKTKQLKLTIPDFENIVSGSVENKIMTNLPVIFNEKKDKLEMFIRDNENTTNIMEITLSFTIKDIDIIKIDNFQKELLLYKINSIKNKKNKLEHIAFTDEREEKLEELNTQWNIMKDDIERFTTKYIKKLEKKNKQNKKQTEFNNNIITLNNQESLHNFHNNYIIKLLSNTLNPIENKIDFIYYVVLNLLINRVNKIETTFDNIPLTQSIVGSIVYNSAEDITLENMFIVKEESSQDYTVFNMEGDVSNLSKDVAEFINDKSINTQYLQNIIDVINIGHVKVQKKILLDQSLLTKKQITYTLNKNTINEDYKDVDSEMDMSAFKINQEEVNMPAYKLMTSMKEFDSFLITDTSKKVYITSNIKHTNIGDAFINAEQDGILVKENCEGCGDSLNLLKNWRVKLTKGFININPSNSQILPIILDEHKFSSVTHYLMFYKNIENLSIANKYLFSGSKGKIQVDISNSDINNDQLNETTNILQIPNILFELARITTAKIVQNKEFTKILSDLNNDITIINAVNDDTSSGNYEIAKELLFVKKYLREGNIHTFYPFYERDVDMASKIHKKTQEEHVTEFIKIRSEKVIKKKEIISNDIEYNIDDVDINYREFSTTEGFMREAHKMLELNTLHRYVQTKLNKEIYDVPTNGDCLYHAVVISLFEQDIFNKLQGFMGRHFSKSNLFVSKEIEIVGYEGIIKRKLFLNNTVSLLRRIVADTIEENYNIYLKFIRSIKIDETTDIQEQISSKIDAVSGDNQKKYRFMDDLVIYVERSRLYTNIFDYINSIRIDSKDSGNYKKGWGSSTELTIISALFGVDIQTYPSNSIDIRNLDSYYKFTFSKSKKLISIPRQYLKRVKKRIETINLGHLTNYPQHYLSIIENVELLETKLGLNIETPTEIINPSNITKDLLEMGFSLELIETALVHTYGNKENAIEFILSNLRTFKGELESDDDKNYLFQLGDISVSIADRMTNIQDFFDLGPDAHSTYFRDYEYLESTHNYIQWLFPTRDASRFHSKKLLSSSELVKLRASDLAKNNLIQTLITMWDFYGADLEFFDDERTGDLNFSILNNTNYRERIENINTRSGLHNTARITRILTYLDLMADHGDSDDFILRLQYNFLDYFITAICQNPLQIVWDNSYFNSSVKTSIEYWVDTIRDLEKRKRYYELIKIYLSQSDQRSSLQFGGKIKRNYSGLEKINEKYYSFSYKYKNFNYDIAYRILPNKKNKNIEILGFLQDGGKIAYDKNIKTLSHKDHILTKLYDQLYRKTLNLKDKEIKKVNYYKDAKSNKIFYGGNIVGYLNNNKHIDFL